METPEKKKIDFDLSEYTAGKELHKMLNPKLDFETPYTFYYDETNNIRTFYVRENDFNYTFTANFVLGGLAIEGEVPDVKDLIDSFKLQKTAKEVKFGLIAHGDFLDCLKSRKLTLYLKFLNETNVYFHFSSLNILFWSLVDIVDSAIVDTETIHKFGPDYIMHLKNDLYKLARLEIDSVVQLFYHYGYPNIKPESLTDFVQKLMEVFAPYKDKPEFRPGIEALNDILQKAVAKGSLPFVMDDEDHILLKDFSQFYLHPLYTFTTSSHIFDNEEEIIKILDGYRILDKGEEFNGFTFVDSLDSPLTQLSDVMVGFMGKYTQYRNTHSAAEIENDIMDLEPLQVENLQLFIDVLQKSVEKNPAFHHETDAISEIGKLHLIRHVLRLKKIRENI